MAEPKFVAGVDGCPGGWVCFLVDIHSMSTSVQVIDLPVWLRNRPPGLACVGIDIPIGLLDGPRACDIAARKLLGARRGSSVFPTPCRVAVRAGSYEKASAVNRSTTGRSLSRQAWGIAPKIRQVDDAITSSCQQWAFEVHPEISFWNLNGKNPMKFKKKSKEGKAERLLLLRTPFPGIDLHLQTRPHHVGADDLLDAAAAAWTALRYRAGNAESVCNAEHDDKGLTATIYF